MKTLLTLSTLLFYIIGYSQTVPNPTVDSNCLVEVEALKGKYMGECKDKKAHGMGTATGKEDSYSGSFKEGYPDGHGIYLYKNGNWMEADWSKGKLNGFSIFHVAGADGEDSTTQEGWYKKGKYVGEYEAPYVVYKTSSSITRTEFRKSKSTKDSRTDLFINLSGITGDKRTDATAAVPLITDIEVLGGNGINRLDKQMFTATRSETTGGVNSYNIVNVKYPLRLKLIMGIESIDFQIFEAGTWSVDIQFFK